MARRNKRQHDVNRAIAFLTIGLLTVTVFDSVASVLVAQGSIQDARIGALAGLAIILNYTIVLMNTGMLSPYDSNASSKG